MKIKRTLSLGKLSPRNCFQGRTFNYNPKEKDDVRRAGGDTEQSTTSKQHVDRNVKSWWRAIFFFLFYRTNFVSFSLHHTNARTDRQHYSFSLSLTRSTITFNDKCFKRLNLTSPDWERLSLLLRSFVYFSWDLCSENFSPDLLYFHQESNTLRPLH